MMLLNLKPPYIHTTIPGISPARTLAGVAVGQTVLKTSLFYPVNSPCLKCRYFYCLRYMTE